MGTFQTDIADYFDPRTYGLALDAKFADSELATTITEEIRASCGIPFSRFQQLCLNEYYRRNARIGDSSKDHFLTSPEQSHLFSLAIVEAAAKVWEVMGRPESFDFIEIGGGSGQFAYDFINQARRFTPDFAASLAYKIIDISDKLIAQQQAKLAGEDITWVHVGDEGLTEKNMPYFNGVCFHNEWLDIHPVDIIGVNSDDLFAQLFINLDSEGYVVEQWRIRLSEQIKAYINKCSASGVPVEQPDYTSNFKFLKPQLMHVANPYGLSAYEIQVDHMQSGAIIADDYGYLDRVLWRKFKDCVREYGPKLALPFGINRASYLRPGEYDITHDVDFLPFRLRGEYLGAQTAYYDTQRNLMDSSRFVCEQATKLSWAERRDFKEMQRGFGSNGVMIQTKNLPPIPFLRREP